jgi:hypothetical protein
MIGESRTRGMRTSTLRSTAVGCNSGVSAFVNGLTPRTVSHGYVAGSVAIRMTTTASASLAPLDAPHDGDTCAA